MFNSIEPDLEASMLYMASRYQRAVGGLSYEDVMNEDPSWMNFTLQAINLEEEAKNRE